jgi:hypothetical protein
VLSRQGRFDSCIPHVACKEGRAKGPISKKKSKRGFVSHFSSHVWLAEFWSNHEMCGKAQGNRSGRRRQRSQTELHGWGPRASLRLSPAERRSSPLPSALTFPRTPRRLPLAAAPRRRHGLQVRPRSTSLASPFRPAPRRSTPRGN